MTPWPEDVVRQVLRARGGMHGAAATNIRRRVHNYWIVNSGYSSAIYTIFGPRSEKYCFLVDATVAERVYLCMSKMMPHEEFSWCHSPSFLVRAKLH